MKKRPSKSAVLPGILAGLLASGAAFANDASLQPGLTGDWGGARTGLADDGLQLQSRAIFEGADNPSGGDRQAATGAGEVDFLGLADLSKLIGDENGSLEAKITDRFGANIVTAAGLNTLMQPQEIWGRSDIWRLTQLSFSQDLFNKKVNLELGRMDPGSDIDVFSCNFENLSFCGAPPGNIEGDYWYNSPVGQWGARARVNISQSVYLEAGGYQINPENIARGFSFDFSGSKGALIPFELGWTPKMFSDLPGLYQVSGWYSTMRAPDVFDDVHNGPLMVTGLPARVDTGRSGFFVSLKQQITGVAPPDGAFPNVNGQGLTLFANFTQADERTSKLDRQFAIGAVYKGAIPSRADDAIALAFGMTHVNDNVVLGEELHDAAALPFEPVQDTEYVTELDYRAVVATDAELTPNLQYIGAPGGVARRDDILVLGLKTVLTL
jgi:porin